MTTNKLPNIPSLRKHQLLLEFASLKTAPPPGVYVSLSPTDPTLWTGVIFVRSGPYASAILRFQIRFPSTYPDLPPLVTFSTDIFHPLLVPLTTYTFTTGSADTTDTVSATDEERLPPGGFSLRHGFPHWFGRARKSATNSAASSRNVSGNSPAPNTSAAGTLSADQGEEESTQSEDTVQQPSTPKKPARDEDPSSASKYSSSPAPTNLSSSTPVRAPSTAPADLQYTPRRRDVPALTLLNYIRTTFDDENVLDSVPLEAAGNPGAWHAWRTHRRSVNSSGDSAEAALRRSSSLRKASPQARLPGEWNWEGVWAQRVQNGIEASMSDAILFGNSPRGGSDDIIRFLNLDSETLAGVKEKIIPKVEEEAPAEETHE